MSNDDKYEGICDTNELSTCSGCDAKKNSAGRKISNGRERERKNKGTRIGNSIASKWPPEVAASANKLRMEIEFLA